MAFSTTPAGRVLMQIWGCLVVRLTRRTRMLLLLLLLMLLSFILIPRTSVMMANVPQLLWLGYDACDIWRAKGISYWQSTEWWHKLCALESEMLKIDYECSDERRMGNRQVCFDPDLIPKNNCLVYSFGIDFDFSFDDAMAAEGCTVYSFDPSMLSVSDHKHADRVYFKRTGIASKDDDHFEPRLDGYVKSPTTWRVRRLATIMKELGHAEGALTIVKIDIESSEWDVVDDILSTEGLFQSIPQLLIEWHLFADTPPRSRYDELLSIFSRFLKDTGFLKFHWNSEGRDHHIKRLRSQSETSWVNPRFVQFARKLGPLK